MQHTTTTRWCIPLQWRLYVTYVIATDTTQSEIASINNVSFLSLPLSLLYKITHSFHIATLSPLLPPVQSTSTTPITLPLLLFHPLPTSRIPVHPNQGKPPHRTTNAPILPLSTVPAAHHRHHPPTVMRLPDHRLPESVPLLSSATPVNSPPSPHPLKPCIRHDITPACSAAPPSSPAALGYFVMLASAFCHALVTFFVHLAEVRCGFPAISALIVRAMTSLTLSSSYLLLNRHIIFSPASRATYSWRLLILLGIRGLAGGLAALLTFVSLAKLPVGTAVTLFYAAPALTAVFSSLFLRDMPLSPQLVVTIVANFIGIALVARPTAAGSNMAGVCCALGVATAASTAFVLTRAMGTRVHFVLSVFAFSLGCATMVACTATKEYFHQVVANRQGVMYAICSGIAGFGSQSFLNKALQLAPAGPATVVRSLNVPLTFVLGLLFLNERPTKSSMVGVGVVLVSVAMIGLLQKVKLGKDAHQRITGTSSQQDRIVVVVDKTY